MKEFDYTSIGQFINENKKKPDDFANQMNTMFVKINNKIKQLDNLKNNTFIMIDNFLLTIQSEFLLRLTTILSYVTVYKNTKHPHNELLLKIEGILIKNIQKLSLDDFLIYKKEYEFNNNLLNHFISKVETYLIEFRYDIITMHDIWVND